MFRRKLSTSLLFGALFVSSCAPSEPPHVGIQEDEFSKDVTIVGVAALDAPLGGPSERWNLRSWVNKDTHAVHHQLYVDFDYYGSWRFYQTAADDMAKPLSLMVIDRGIISCVSICDFSETVGIALDDADLRERVATGFRVKISAKSGDSVILPITPQMIGLQLEAVDKYARPGSASLTRVPKPAHVPWPAGKPLDKENFGIGIVAMPELMAKSAGVDPGHGVWVYRVDASSSAEAVGLQLGDVILRWNGTPVNSPEQLIAAVESSPSAKSISIVIRRDRNDLTLSGTF